MRVWAQGDFLVVQIGIGFGCKFLESHFLPLTPGDDRAHLEGRLGLTVTAECSWMGFGGHHSPALLEWQYCVK